MPALPNVSNVIRVDLIHTDSGDAHVGSRTFWRYSAAAPSNADCAILASHVSGLWASYLAGLASTSVELVEIVCTDLSLPTGGRGSVTATHQGVRVGDPLPDNVCTLINYEIQRRYRGGKPRSYFPYGVRQDINPDEQTWTAAYVGTVNSAWSTFSSNMNGNGFGGSVLHEQQNVSYYSGVNAQGVPETPPGIRIKNKPTVRTTTQGEPITGFACNPVLGSQRRRLRAK